MSKSILRTHAVCCGLLIFRVLTRHPRAWTISLSLSGHESLMGSFQCGEWAEVTVLYVMVFTESNVRVFVRAAAPSIWTRRSMRCLMNMEPACGTIPVPHLSIYGARRAYSLICLHVTCRRRYKNVWKARWSFSLQEDEKTDSSHIYSNFAQHPPAISAL